MHCRICKVAPLRYIQQEFLTDGSCSKPSILKSLRMFLFIKKKKERERKRKTGKEIHALGKGYLQHIVPKALLF